MGMKSILFPLYVSPFYKKGKRHRMIDRFTGDVNYFPDILYMDPIPTSGAKQKYSTSDGQKYPGRGTVFSIGMEDGRFHIIR